MKLVVTELRASVRMRPGKKTIGFPGMKTVRIHSQPFRDPIHAANRRDNPDFIADTGRTILAAISVKGRWKAGDTFHIACSEPAATCTPFECRCRIPGIFEFPGQPGCQVVSVNMFTFGDVMAGQANRGT